MQVLRLCIMYIMYYSVVYFEGYIPMSRHPLILKNLVRLTYYHLLIISLLFSRI